MSINRASAVRKMKSRQTMRTRREVFELKRKPMRKMTLYILAAALFFLAVWTLIRYIDNLGSSYQMLG